MQLASGSHIPDGLLAANALLSEKLHQGFAAPKSTLHQGFGVSISSTPLGIIRPLYDGDVRSRYTGKERDTETGLDYFGARYYASNMGRFMSPDPVQISKQRMIDPQQWNMYSYARNEPLGHLDPDGREVTVFTETGGVGHTFVEINNGNHQVIISYGRYAGGSSGHNWRGASPTGPGILIRIEGKANIDKFLAARAKSDPTLKANVVSVPNEEGAYKNLQTRFDGGTALTDKEKTTMAGSGIDTSNARQVEGFNLFTNNCTTTTNAALQAGGADIGGVFTPSQERDQLNPPPMPALYSSYGDNLTGGQNTNTPPPQQQTTPPQQQPHN
jgi:RHS repeat-associated protein